MTLEEFRSLLPGDIVVGNELANEHYRTTKEGWTGEVTCVDSKDNYFFDAGGFRLEFQYFNILTKRGQKMRTYFYS